MTPLQFIRTFVSFFFVLFAVMVIGKVFNDYTNEEIGASLRTYVPYVSAAVGSLIFTVAMFFVAKRGEKKEA